MDGAQLYIELQQRTRMVDAAVSELRRRGTALAEAERDYRIAKAEAIMREREKGTPATLTADLVKGSKRIAELCFERDCAQVVYDSAREALNAYKLQARLIEGQIQREWEQARRT